MPTIVVCYDSMYKDAQPGGVAPGRAELLETAREWVRYANVTRKYGIKYWEIGNEVNHSPYWRGTLQTYVTNYLKPAWDVIHAQGHSGSNQKSMRVVSSAMTPSLHVQPHAAGVRLLLRGWTVPVPLPEPPRSSSPRILPPEWKRAARVLSPRSSIPTNVSRRRCRVSGRLASCTR